jgi:hypothetical protein
MTNIQNNNQGSKIFIVGLPRTGTTSICSTMLELGFSVAHTAYTQKTFERANVIADTPIFNDFELLDKHYPNSQYIYLTRESQKWIPSIRQLLLRMYENVVRDDGGFNPIIKRCYTEIFSPFTLDNINNDEFLLACYEQHKQNVIEYFAQQKRQLLIIDISNDNDYPALVDFLGMKEQHETHKKFPLLNQGGKVTAWKDIKHAKKVESTKNGRCSTLDHINALINT